MKGLLDGGSIVMLIGEEVAKDCKIEIKKFNGKLKSAFNQFVPIRGVCYLKYVFDNKERVVRAFVAGRTSCPLILGSDFFGANGLILDHGLNKIWFRRECHKEQIEVSQNQVVIEFKASTEMDWKSVARSVDSDHGSSGKSANSEIQKPWPRHKEEQPDGGSAVKRELGTKAVKSTEKKEKTVNIKTSYAENNICYIDVEEHIPSRTEEIFWAEAYPSRHKISTVTERPKKYSVNKFFDRNSKESFLEAFDFSGLSPQEAAAVAEILWEYNQVISEDDYDVGLCPEFVQPIKTKEDFELRFKKHGIRKYRQEDKEFMSDWSKIMKSRGIVVPSDSHISCAAHVVRSMNRTARLVLDYRPLNSHIETQDYPYVSIQETFDQMAGMVFFTSIDLTMAFYSIAIKSEDQWKTSFTTHNELLMMTRLPMGLSLSPKAMQNLTNRLVDRRDHLIAYIDDVLCISRSFEDHLIHFRNLMQRLSDFNLKVKPKKCQLFKRKIQFLGFEVSESGIAVPYGRVKAIMEIPKPRNQKGIKSFLGMINFPCRHLVQIGEFTEPLNQLLRKDTPFVWTSHHQKCFERLKEIMSTAPVLDFANESLKKVLITDASDKAIGGMLGQIRDNEIRPLAYFNKTLSRAERKWTTSEKELWAIVYGIRKHKKYLNNAFDVFTDHKPLLCLNRFKDIKNQRLNRWGMEISAYQFTIRYIKGVDNQIADGLSRLLKDLDMESNPTDTCESYQLAHALDRDAEEDSHSNGEACDEAIPGGITSEDGLTHAFLLIDPVIDVELGENKLIEEQNRDIFCQNIKSKITTNGKQNKSLKKRFEIINGILHRKKRRSARNSGVRQVVIPTTLVNNVIELFHESPHEGGHRGAEATEKDIANRYWFENIREHIRSHIKVCRVCNRVKPVNTKPYGIPHVIEMPVQPFEHIHMDVCGPFLKSKRGRYYILTIVCRTTRYIYAKAMANHTKETVMTAMIKMFNKFTTPKILTTDRAPEFMSEAFQEFLNGLGIRHQPTASYYAASNGLAEVNNRKLVQIIRSYVNDRSKDWDSFVGLAAKIINRTVNATTNYSPFYLLFGFDPCNSFERKFKLEVYKHCNENEEQNQSEECVLEKARHEARLRVLKAEEEWRKIRENNLTPPPFGPKSLVWAIDKTQEPGIPHKLRPLKCGPWIVTREIVPGTYHIFPMVKMGGKERRVKVVNARFLFPYLSERKPRGYQEMCQRIDQKEFETTNPDEIERVPWDVMNLNEWNRQIEESRKQSISERNLRSQTSQNKLSQISTQMWTQESDGQQSQNAIPISDFTSEPNKRLENFFDIPIDRQESNREKHFNREKFEEEWKQLFSSGQDSSSEFTAFSPPIRQNVDTNERLKTQIIIASDHTSDENSSNESNGNLTSEAEPKVRENCENRLITNNEILGSGEETADSQTAQESQSRSQRTRRPPKRYANFYVKIPKKR